MSSWISSIIKFGTITRSIVRSKRSLDPSKRTICSTISKPKSPQCFKSYTPLFFRPSYYSIRFTLKRYYCSNTNSSEAVNDTELVSTPKPQYSGPPLKFWYQESKFSRTQLLPLMRSSWELGTHSQTMIVWFWFLNQLHYPDSNKPRVSKQYIEKKLQLHEKLPQSRFPQITELELLYALIGLHARQHHEHALKMFEQYYMHSKQRSGKWPELFPHMEVYSMAYEGGKWPQNWRCAHLLALALDLAFITNRYGTMKFIMSELMSSKERIYSSTSDAARGNKFQSPLELLSSYHQAACVLKYLIVQSCHGTPEELKGTLLMLEMSYRQGRPISKALPGQLVTKIIQEIGKRSNLSNPQIKKSILFFESLNEGESVSSSVYEWSAMEGFEKSDEAMALHLHLQELFMSLESPALYFASSPHYPQTQFNPKYDVYQNIWKQVWETKREKFEGLLNTLKTKYEPEVSPPTKNQNDFDGSPSQLPLKDQPEQYPELLEAQDIVHPAEASISPWRPTLMLNVLREILKSPHTSSSFWKPYYLDLCLSALDTPCLAKDQAEIFQDILQSSVEQGCDPAFFYHFAHYRQIPISSHVQTLLMHRAMYVENSPETVVELFNDLTVNHGPAYGHAPTVAMLLEALEKKNDISAVYEVIQLLETPDFQRNWTSLKSSLDSAIHLICIKGVKPESEQMVPDLIDRMATYMPQTYNARWKPIWKSWLASHNMNITLPEVRSSGDHSYL